MSQGMSTLPLAENSTLGPALNGRAFKSCWTFHLKPSLDRRIWQPAKKYF
jgi:hypothetical protein